MIKERRGQDTVIGKGCNANTLGRISIKNLPQTPECIFIHDTPPLVNALSHAFSFSERNFLSQFFGSEDPWQRILQRSKLYNLAYLSTQAVRRMHQGTNPNYRGVGLEPTRIGIDGSANRTAQTMSDWGDYVIQKFTKAQPGYKPENIIQILQGIIVDLDALVSLDQITNHVVRTLNDQMHQHAEQSGNLSALRFQANTHRLVRAVYNLPLEGPIGSQPPEITYFIEKHPEIRGSLAGEAITRVTQRYMIPVIKTMSYPEVDIPTDKSILKGLPHIIMEELLRIGHPVPRAIVSLFTQQPAERLSHALLNTRLITS